MDHEIKPRLNYSTQQPQQVAAPPPQQISVPPPQQTFTQVSAPPPQQTFAQVSAPPPQQTAAQPQQVATNEPIKWGYWVTGGLVLIIVILIITIVNLVQKTDLLGGAMAKADLDKYDKLTDKKKNKSQAVADATVEDAAPTKPAATTTTTTATTTAAAAPIAAYNPITVL